MYQSPTQSGGASWTPNPPPTSQSNQPPPQWPPNTQSANNQYQPRPNPNQSQHDTALRVNMGEPTTAAAAAIDPALSSGANINTDQDDAKQLTPISQAVQQQGAPPAMQTLQPNHPDQYRALPPPQQMYGPPYQQAPQMAYPPTQPAPRQRTAIACRYCRRRKIRCSGFDQSEDGRCTNCQRFSQECVFTPVSAQTQAFVPAHTVWRGQNPPPNTQLYGAYGQPLPQHGNRDQYQQQQQQQQQPGQYPPPPQGYQQQQPMYSQQGGPQAQNAEAGRKRPNDEPHTPTIAPPNPGEQSQMPQHRGADGQPYGYPDPSGLTPAGASLNSSSTSYYPAQHPPQPYHVQSQAQARGGSPQSTYSYDASRASSSPHALGQPGIFTSFQHGVAVRDGRTPPTSAANAQRHSGKVNDLAGQPKLEERTSTDSSMLQALNRGPK